MHIYLPEIRSKPGEAVDYSFEEKLSDCFDDFWDGGALKLLISASSSGDKVIITGSLEVSALAVCSRCLEQFEHHFKTDFTEAFTILKIIPIDSSPEMLAAETANMLTVTGDYLYIDEYIRQLIILAQDYSPLCSSDCKGICASCGADLNKETCQCIKKDHVIDARLMKLKELN